MRTTLAILSRPLPVSARTGLSYLVESADQTGKRIYATIPFEKKDVLKERGYRWNNGADGRPRSWYIDLEADQCDAETNYLKREILGERGSLSIVERSAENRFTLPG